jgi:hypothetical protein
MFINAEPADITIEILTIKFSTGTKEKARAKIRLPAVKINRERFFLFLKNLSSAKTIKIRDKSGKRNKREKISFSSLPSWRATFSRTSSKMMKVFFVSTLVLKSDT